MSLMPQQQDQGAQRPRPQWRRSPGCRCWTGGGAEGGDGEAEHGAGAGSSETGGGDGGEGDTARRPLRSLEGLGISLWKALTRRALE